MEETEKTLGDYLAILKRRKWHIVIPAVVLTIISIVVANLLPPVYRSEATILIEEQEIPHELVRSTVTSYAAQRIQVISQRVMTRASLSEIIDKFNLYADERDTKTRDELVQEMRGKVSLDMVSADVIDPRSGRPQEATIAFTLAFESKSPQLAQRVTNELVTLFLNENIKTRREQAAEASDFFSEEAERLNEQISALEAQLATFKQNNVGRLPEQAELNMQLMERTERALDDTLRRMQSLEERKIFLDAELRQTEPFRGVVERSGQAIASPQERLRFLESEYIRLHAIYSDEHPDVVRARNEIAALKRETGEGDRVETLQVALAEQQAAYDAALKKYSADHPDVVKLRAAVDALTISLDEATKNAKNDTQQQSLNQQPDNPAYIALSSQLQAVNGELEAAQRQRSALQEKLEDYEARLIATPEIEREYRMLTRDYESAMHKYQEIKAKQMEAQVAQQLESEAKGERFTLIEPPEMPEKPVKPNRPAIMFLGFIFAIGAGIGLAALSEALDRSVRGSRGVLAVLDQAPLAVIPYIETEADIRRRKRRMAVGGVAAVGAVAIGLVVIHAMWMPLDVAWFALQRKLEARFG